MRKKMSKVTSNMHPNQQRKMWEEAANKYYDAAAKKHFDLLSGLAFKTPEEDSPDQLYDAAGEPIKTRKRRKKRSPGDILYRGKNGRLKPLLISREPSFSFNPTRNDINY